MVQATHEPSNVYNWLEKVTELVLYNCNLFSLSSVYLFYLYYFLTIQVYVFF